MKTNMDIEKEIRTAQMPGKDVLKITALGILIYFFSFDNFACFVFLMQTFVASLLYSR